MELDENSLDGHWAKDNNLDVEFFIINDAVFSKLCILGDDVEPCFEGSSVISTESSGVSEQYSIDTNFSQTLFSMMNELADAMHSEGGLRMPKPNDFAEQAKEEEAKSTEPIVEASAADVQETEVVEESAVETVDYTDAENAPAAEVEEEVEDDDKDDSETNFAETSENKEEDVEEAPSVEHSLEEYEALVAENENLRAEIESLREFKLSVENEQKDALFEKFPYNTLAEEDIKDVKEHKSDYSLDEIESKLAVIYVEKGVHFEESHEKEETEEEGDGLTTFSLDGEVTGPLTELQEALRNTVH